MTSPEGFPFLGPFQPDKKPLYVCRRANGVLTNALHADAFAWHMKDADHVGGFVCTPHLRSPKRDVIYGFGPRMTCRNLTHVRDSFRGTSPSSFRDVML